MRLFVIQLEKISSNCICHFKKFTMKIPYIYRKAGGCPSRSPLSRSHSRVKPRIPLDHPSAATGAVAAVAAAMAVAQLWP